MQLIIMNPLKTWRIMYPIYIDSEFSREKGRRVSKACSAKSPKLKEIS